MRINYSALLSLITISLLTACGRHQTQTFGATDKTAVKDSVFKMTADIEADISTKGPATWLNYFEDSPDFFMANDGVLAFHDYKSASAFIRDTLLKNISKINLKWSNTRVDPLTPCLASIGSDYHEDITFATGATMPFDGYFSGVAHLTPKGWRLRNVHWSSKSSH